MIITKDIENFFSEKYNSDEVYLPFSKCAKLDGGKVNITSARKAFAFDLIIKALKLNHASVDCVFFHKNYIDLIEFKDGIIDKISDEYLSIETDCEQCKILHRERFDAFKEKQKWHKKVLHQNIQLKAVESLYFILHYFLPQCVESEKKLQIRFICVFQTEAIDPLEEYEIQQLEISKNADKKINENKNSLVNLLKSYRGVDAYGNKLFYEDCKVMTNLEFNSRSEFN